MAQMANLNTTLSTRSNIKFISMSVEGDDEKCVEILTAGRWIKWFDECNLSLLSIFNMMLRIWDRKTQTFHSLMSTDLK